MLSSAYCLAKEKLTYQKLLPAINKELNAMGLASVESVRFVAGTMFYARPQIFKPMLRYEIGDFEESSSEIKEGTMAHVAERLLGVLTEQSGFEISAIKHDGYSFRFALTAIKRFLFQKKITTSGHLIVKVCHLPVLHWKGYRV